LARTDEGISLFGQGCRSTGTTAREFLPSFALLSPMRRKIMRFVVFAALSVLTLSLFDARPASAGWQCMGGELACGGSAHASKKAKKVAKAYQGGKGHKVAYSKSSKRVASYSKSSSRKVAKVRKSGSSSVASSGSYGGGSSGIASYYWQGQMTASGARFNPGAMTAAHRTLPFGTRVLVTNHSNGRSVTVTINDRGPFVKGRIIDLSKAAAGAIGMQGQGLARVSVSVLGRG
jgi:rare lipoprotein A